MAHVYTQNHKRGGCSYRHFGRLQRRLQNFGGSERGRWLVVFLCVITIVRVFVICARLVPGGGGGAMLKILARGLFLVVLCSYAHAGISSFVFVFGFVRVQCMHIVTVDADADADGTGTGTMTQSGPTWTSIKNETAS